MFFQFALSLFCLAVTAGSYSRGTYALAAFNAFCAGFCFGLGAAEFIERAVEKWR